MPVLYTVFGLPRYSLAFTFYKLRKAVYDYFVSEATPGMKVLEVGCGAGVNIKMINDLVPEAKEIEFFGVDISPKRIEEANLYKEKEGMKNCFFEVREAESLGCDDSQFDIVICTEVLEHLLDARIALQEMHRVLKPGACAIISTPNSGNFFAKIAGKRVKERLERDDIKREPHQLIDGAYGHISVLSSRELLSISKEAGFTIERMMRESIVYGLHFYDRHQFLFAILLILDSVLDHLPRNYSFSWGVILKLRKDYDY